MSKKAHVVEFDEGIVVDVLPDTHYNDIFTISITKDTVLIYKSTLYLESFKKLVGYKLLGHDKKMIPLSEDYMLYFYLSKKEDIIELQMNLLKGSLGFFQERFFFSSKEK